MSAPSAKSPPAATAAPAGRRRRRVLRLLGELLFVAVAFTAVHLWQTRELIGGGELAPAFTLPRLSGGPAVDLAALRGRKVVLHFWAPWCGVCKAVAPNVARAARWLGQDAQVLSVALAFQDLAQVKAGAERLAGGGTIVVGDERVESAYRISQYPTVYVLDEQGRIEHVAIGYTTTLGLYLRARF